MEMTPLFGDDDMVKLLGMFPTTESSLPSADLPKDSEDSWMSTWLKEEPVFQEATVF